MRRNNRLSARLQYCLPLPVLRERAGVRADSDQRRYRNPLTLTLSQRERGWSNSLTRLLLIATIGLAAMTSAYSSAATVPSLAKLEVSPPDVDLNTSRDGQLIVAQATMSDGTTRDVTSEAKLTLTDAKLAKLDGATLYPVADGQTELKVEFGGQAVSVPVRIRDATADRPISFKLDVMPVFAKAGCNTGSCHGAARGKDGFRLSLFGFDPDGDYFRLTREINGRRINLALPHESLMLDKAAGRVHHTGGTRFKEDSEHYQTLGRWLEAGAPQDAADVAKPIGIELFPKSAVLNGQGATQQLTLRAKYSDGTDRDVTRLAYFMSNNDMSAQVSPEGLVTAGERGEAFILARFDAFSVGTHLVVLPKDVEFSFPAVAANNYIDTLIHDKLRKLRIAPSELAADEVFLRRAHLDIVGLLPTPDEHQRFMASTAPDKRERLIDELLQREEFVEIWVMKWAELLQIRSTNRVSTKATVVYYDWLREQIANNVPIDRLVRELLVSKGGTFTDPASNYYQNEIDTLKTAENVAQVFMGMRIQCAQCHNHPFDRWTMDDYYGFSAFFAQLRRKRGEDPREYIIYNAGGGELRHPLGGRPMAPKFLGGDAPDTKGKDRREVLASWLASPQNPYFATNLANIVWAHFFGRGIIDEVDDVRVSNPPVNPELLDELGRRFTQYNYDLKKLVRDICTSRTYQLATQTNETNAGDDRNFSHAALRRIRAEVLLDCITEVTDTKNKFNGLPLGARAVEIADGNTTNYFLTTFGRATRTTVCSCEVKMEPSLSQALHLMNGDTVSQKIEQGGLITRRLKEKIEPRQIVEELYIRCFSRLPSPEEMAVLDEVVATSSDKRRALEDVLWALLNSREFLFNH